MHIRPRHLLGNANIAGLTPFVFADSGGILGTEEFVDAMIHRIGEFDTRSASLRRKADCEIEIVDLESLVRSVEVVCQIARQEFCGSSKSARQVFAKEVFIVSGRQLGSRIADLSRILGLSSPSTSRRCDSALRRMPDDLSLSRAVELVTEEYSRNPSARIVIK